MTLKQANRWLALLALVAGIAHQTLWGLGDRHVMIGREIGEATGTVLTFYGIGWIFAGISRLLTASHGEDWQVRCKAGVVAILICFALVADGTTLVRQREPSPAPLRTSTCSLCLQPPVS